jgi:F1F0 ATPase subunit 2
MIAQAIDLLGFATVGAAIGALCFGRLWLALSQLPPLRHPMLWLLADTLARLTLVLAAFLLVSRGSGRGWAPASPASSRHGSFCSASRHARPDPAAGYAPNKASRNRSFR